MASRPSARRATLRTCLRRLGRHRRTCHRMSRRRLGRHRPTCHHTSPSRRRLGPHRRTCHHTSPSPRRLGPHRPTCHHTSPSRRRLGRHTTVRATLRPPDASAITTLRATVRSADAAGGADVPDRHAEAERVRGRAERADPPGDRAGGQVQVLPAGAGGGGPGRGAVPLHHHPRAPAQHQHLPPHRAQPAHHLRQARAVGLPVPAALRLMNTTTSQHFYTRRHACMM
ncbi:Ribonucleoside-diphosphate reductase large subunit [Zea mays]|uniref:Ribonucleoside-diphosphate reductase large subunit n=1 Tax=Zea mays TaxID=4577 RepID=A0A1D6NUE3_MAIZE|nr:Ribonucleoside-diphosphate reductase large subunit [Zea mays]